MLDERLAPPLWHKVVAFAALGVALAAAVAISLSEERERLEGRSADGDLRPAGARSAAA